MFVTFSHLWTHWHFHSFAIPAVMNASIFCSFLSTFADDLIAYQEASIQMSALPIVCIQ